MCRQDYATIEAKKLHNYCNEYAGTNDLSFSLCLGYLIYYCLITPLADAVQQASGNNHVELKAMGKAINKAVTIAEILKHKMPLHQITALSSCEIVNVYEPLEEGLDTVVNQHYVSCITITLSTDLTGIDVHNIGYQPPVSESELQPGDFNAHPGTLVATSRNPT